MDKKGQVYLLAAIIISVIVFSLAATKNTVTQEKLNDDFSTLSEVYNVESARFLNTLFEEKKINPSLDVGQKFFDFSYNFASYSKSQNPNYELFYVFKTEESKILVGNFLNTSIAVYVNDSPAPLVTVNGCFETLDAKVSLGGIQISAPIVGGVDCSASKDISGNKIKLCMNPDTGRPTCYPLTLSGKPQLLIVTGASEGDQRQVYVGGEGLIDETAIGDIGSFDEENP